MQTIVKAVPKLPQDHAAKRGFEVSPYLTVKEIAALAASLELVMSLMASSSRLSTVLGRL